MRQNETQSPMEKAHAALATRAKPGASGTSLKALLEANAENIRVALPKHMTAERTIRIAWSAISRSPGLLGCDPTSLVKSVIEASELGLECSGVLGHAYLVPYRNGRTKRMEAQLQIGYRGLIELAYRSGRVASIGAEVVYNCDQWDFQLGSERFLKHRPKLERPPGAEAVFAYATVDYKDGGGDFEICLMPKIEQAKRASRARGDDSPWVTYFDEMARKTAIRRLAKRLPLSPELQKAAVVDEYREQGIPAALSDGALVIDVLAEDCEGASAPSAASADEQVRDVQGEQLRAESAGE